MRSGGTLFKVAFPQIQWTMFLLSITEVVLIHLFRQVISHLLRFIFSFPFHLHTAARFLRSILLIWVTMAAIATAEACDANAALLTTGDVRALQPVFKIYGQRRTFSGPIVTLRVFEDNVLVRELLETKGEGRVLVIDGGASMRCALVGGNLGQLAQNMGWNGIVVNGCIRDVDEINECDIGVRALASHPVKSNKRGIGEKHVVVHIGGAQVRDGEWLYADSDGILVSKTELVV